MYDTIRTTTMMIMKIGSTPPPIQSKMSGTVDPFLPDRRHDQPVAGDPDHLRGRAGCDVARCGRAVFVRLTFLLDEHAAVVARQDPDRHEGRVADEIAHRERLFGLSALEE